jgi:hypothetical protein
VRSAAEIAALLVKRQREFGPHLRADFRHYSAPTNCAAVALFRHCSHVPFDERPVAGNQVMAAGSGGGNASKSTYPRSRSIAMRCASITRSSSGVASAGTPSSSSLLSMCLTALSRGWRYGAANPANWAASRTHLRTSSKGALALRPVCASE